MFHFKLYTSAYWLLQAGETLHHCLWREQCVWQPSWGPLLPFGDIHGQKQCLSEIQSHADGSHQRSSYVATLWNAESREGGHRWQSISCRCQAHPCSRTQAGWVPKKSFFCFVWFSAETFQVCPQFIAWKLCNYAGDDTPTRSLRWISWYLIYHNISVIFVCRLFLVGNGDS